MASVPLISIVDDDESVRESLQGLIRSVGFAVKLFASANEYLVSAYLGKTDCLVLDVRMPKMNGLDLQRQLAINHKEIPVIFITAHGDIEERSRALKAGAVDYLLKPFSEEALLTAIGTALSSNCSDRRALNENLRMQGN